MYNLVAAQPATKKVQTVTGRRRVLVVGKPGSGKPGVSLLRCAMDARCNSLSLTTFTDATSSSLPPPSYKHVRVSVIFLVQVKVPMIITMPKDVKSDLRI